MCPWGQGSLLLSVLQPTAHVVDERRQRIRPARVGVGRRRDPVEFGGYLVGLLGDAPDARRQIGGSRREQKSMDCAHNAHFPVPLPVPCPEPPPPLRLPRTRNHASFI